MLERRAWVPALVLGVAATALVGHALAYPFVCDDAYITFRYSYNLAHHGQLTFNLGERVEGYTNFLWAVLLAGGMRLGVAPEIASRALGALAGVASLLLVYLLGRLYRGGPRTGWDVVAPLLLAATGGFAVWCSGGLETQLFTALMLGGVTLYVAEQGGLTRRRLSGLLLALAAMTRPEGMLIFGLTGLHLAATNLARERRVLPTRAEVRWALGFLVPFGAFFAWRYSYYGYPFPNTYYVKTGIGPGVVTKWGLPYLWDFIRDNRLYLVAPLLLLYPVWLARRPAGAPETRVRPAFLWSYLGLILAVYAAYIVKVGGDFMAMGRFFVPLLPLLALWLQESLRELVERWPGPGPRGWRPARMVPVALLLLAASGWNAARLWRENRKPAYYRWGLDTIAYLKKFADDRVLLGTWMRENMRPETYIAVGGAGAIVYASRFRALDAFGLNDLYIAHNVPAMGDRPGHAKFAPASYVLSKKPDLICHIGKHQDTPYRPDELERRYWAERGYEWTCLAPPGLRPRYYCCLQRLGDGAGGAGS